MTDSQRESQSRFAAATARAVFERQHSAVAFGDLAAERESDARPARLGCERDEEVRVTLILGLQPQAASRARATERQGLKGADYLLPKASDINSPGSDPPPSPRGLCHALPPHRAEPEGRPGCLRPQAPRPSKPPLPPGLANSPAMNLDSFSSTCSSLAPFFIPFDQRQLKFLFQAESFIIGA